MLVSAAFTKRVISGQDVFLSFQVLSKGVTSYSGCVHMSVPGMQCSNRTADVVVDPQVAAALYVFGRLGNHFTSLGLVYTGAIRILTSTLWPTHKMKFLRSKESAITNVWHALWKRSGALT